MLLYINRTVKLKGKFAKILFVSLKDGFVSYKKALFYD